MEEKDVFKDAIASLLGKCDEEFQLGQLGGIKADRAVRMSSTIEGAILLRLYAKALNLGQEIIFQAECIKDDSQRRFHYGTQLLSIAPILELSAKRIREAIESGNDE